MREAMALPTPPDYVYLLNPDATPDPGAVQALVAFMDAHPSAAIAGSAIHDPDGTPHCSAFRFPSLLSELEAGLRFGPASALLRDHTVYMAVPDRELSGRLGQRREHGAAHERARQGGLVR